MSPNVEQHCLRLSLNLYIYLHRQNAPAKLMMFEGLIVIFAVAIVVCVNGLNLSTDTFAVWSFVHSSKWPYTVSNGLTVCLLFHSQPTCMGDGCRSTTIKISCYFIFSGGMVELIIQLTIYWWVKVFRMCECAAIDFFPASGLTWAISSSFKWMYTNLHRTFFSFSLEINGKSFSIIYLNYLRGQRNIAFFRSFSMTTHFF